MQQTDIERRAKLIYKEEVDGRKSLDTSRMAQSIVNKIVGYVWIRINLIVPTSGEKMCNVIITVLEIIHYYVGWPNLKIRK